MTVRVTGDRGSATIWAAVTCALLLVVGAMAVGRTAAVLVRHRVEAAADLAALAGAGRIGVGPDSCAAARQVARANSAILRKCRVQLRAGGRSGIVDVEVQVVAQLPLVGAQTVHAHARAGRLTGARSP